MTRKSYKKPISQAITSHVVGKIPQLKVVRHDWFWNQPANEDKLLGRLPGAFTRYAFGAAEPIDSESFHWEASFNLHVLDTLEDNDSYKFEEWLDRTQALFTQGDYRLPGLAEAGLVIDFCYPTADGVFDDLIDFGIGGVFTTLTVGYSVSPTPP